MATAVVHFTASFLSFLSVAFAVVVTERKLHMRELNFIRDSAPLTAA